MLYGAKVTVGSEMNTEHINTVCVECTILNVKPFVSSNNQ